MLSSLDVVSLVLQTSLAAILGFAGIAKMRDRKATLTAVQQFGFSREAKVVALTVPTIELILSAAFFGGEATRLAAIISFVLFVAFTAVIVRSVLSGAHHECNCFGAATKSRVGWAMVWRNIVFCCMAAYVAILPARGARSHLFAAIAWGVRAHFVAAFLIVVFVIGLIQLALTLVIVARDNVRWNRAIDPIADDTVGVKLGSAVPDFTLQALDGRPRSWNEKVKPYGSVLLLFVSPRCSACSSLADIVTTVNNHSLNIRVLLISQGSFEENRRVFTFTEPEDVLIQQGSEIAKLLRVRATPSGYVVSHDGRTRTGLLSGPDPIRDVLATFVSVPAAVDAKTVDEPGDFQRVPDLPAPSLEAR